LRRICGELARLAGADSVGHMLDASGAFLSQSLAIVEMGRGRLARRPFGDG
jgi:hypothetical protein